MTHQTDFTSFEEFTDVLHQLKHRRASALPAAWIGSTGRSAAERALQGFSPMGLQA